MFVILRVAKQFTDYMKHIDYAGGEKSMGFYLNSVLPYKRYKKMSATSYFVDKTNILRDLFDCIEEETQYICITRPRRFGKTIMANMIGAFLGKGRIYPFPEIAVKRSGIRCPSIYYRNSSHRKIFQRLRTEYVHGV